MDRTELKNRATVLLYTTRPRPYIVTAFLVLIYQLISMLSTNIGGQPFVLNMSAAQSGNWQEAVTFAPENLKTSTSLILLGLQIVYMTIELGYLSYCLHAARRNVCRIIDLMDGFLVFFRGLVLRTAIFLLVYLASLLLLVPGLIVYYTYSLSTKLLLDHPDWSPFRCMSESRRLMRGHKMELFRLRLSLLFWNIMALFPLTAVFARPYATLSETEFYLELTGTNIIWQEEDPDEKPPWQY